VIIELHLLQSFPVSNLNRDDLGQPKTVTFGGHTRARISSQSLKRSARLLFTQHGLGESETGIRTKRLVDKVVEVLVSRDRQSDQAAAVAQAALERLGFGVDPQRRLTQYLLFVGRTAIDHLAEYCTENWDDLVIVVAAKSSGKTAKVKPDKTGLADAKRILDAGRVADIALFGRMIADNKDFNVDAASQVAHPLSTHAVANEFDFYTAVDDLKPDSESGADMIGTVDFNAACYYRYANLDTDQLKKNLGGDIDLVARSTRAWLYAFINAVPGGKQNSMSARTMPDTLFGVVREHGAWSLANAFLKPIVDDDIMGASTQAMLRQFLSLRSFYGESEIRAATVASVTGTIEPAEHIEATTTVDDFVGRLVAGAGV
jgi:CRISPR system Cascade subunit CasC